MVAVGGTTLDYSTLGGYTQKGWTGSGGGISQYESQPNYQNGIVTQSSTKRTIPDLAFTADSVMIFDTYDGGGFYGIGGTSVATPIMAGLVSIIDQTRGTASYSGQDFLNRLYSLPANAFTDITTGDNGLFTAGPGYDLVTGLGTPNVPNFGLGFPQITSTIAAPADMSKWAGWASGNGQVVVALTSGGQLQYSIGGGLWTTIDTTVKDFGIATVNGTKALVYVLNNGQMRMRTDLNGAWTNINLASDVQSMAVDKKGDLYVLSFNNHGVWRYLGGMGWTNVDPADDVQSIAVDKKGDLYALASLTMASGRPGRGGLDRR